MENNEQKQKDHGVIVNRIFYIDVSGVLPDNISNYLEEVKKIISDGSDVKYVELAKTVAGLIDWHDFYIPTRNGETRVEILTVNV